MQLREKPQAAPLRLADVSANRCCHCCHGERQVHMLLLKAPDDALWLPFFQLGWQRETGGGGATHASSESVFTRRVWTGEQRKAAVGVRRREKTTERKGISIWDFDKTAASTWCKTLGNNNFVKKKIEQLRIIVFWRFQKNLLKPKFFELCQPKGELSNLR